MSEHQDQFESGASALVALANQFDSNDKLGQLVMEVVLEVLMEKQQPKQL